MPARGRELAPAAALMLALALLLVHGLRSDGITNDEPLYIASGWLQVSRGDYRLNTTHPPLGQKLAALGLLGLSPHTPPFEGGDVMAWCYRFLHVENDAGRMVARARAPVVVLTLGLALLTALWARQAAGARAGLIALALFAFHPSLIAHGHLATTDVAATGAMMAASWCFWRWTRRSTWAWALATAAMLGAALSTRLTAAVLLPCFAALAVFESARAEERRVVLRRSLGLAAAVLVVVPTVIWAAHGFRNPAGRVGGNGTAAAARPGEGRSSGLRPSAVLPSAYVEGIRFQADHNRRGHMAYLLGERSRTGWRHYFAVAFLVKSTPGWLLLVALAAGVSAVGRGAGDVPRWHWLLPALATFAAVSAGHIQIGERYLLPVHASLVPWTASVLALWTRGGTRPRVRVAVVAAGLAAHAGPSLLAAGPGHLAYFNLLAGGTASGHRVLLDSNLDWGQDLPRLATWMRRRGVPSVQLAYMGSDDPARYGIRREDLPGRHLYPARPAPGLAGTVAVSPNLLFDLLPGLAGQYAALRDRPPDERAGVFFIYHLGAPAAGPP